jgi:predicted dehydrogenase
MIGQRKVNLAICGLGSFAKRRILSALVACPNIQLVAVVGAGAGVSELSPEIRRFNSLDALLESDLADAVYIATPNYLHASQTIQCLSALTHVICEKPMALNSQDCEAMLESARSRNLQLTVGHMLRHSAALQELQNWLGLPGPLRSVDVSFSYELTENKRPWAFDKKFSGGGALIDAGVHCVDATRFLFGDPVYVLDAEIDSMGSSGVERAARCRFTVAGVSGSLTVCSNAPYKSIIVISGDEGQIVVEGFAACWGMATLKFISSKDQCLNKEMMVDVSGTYARQLQDFAGVILSGNINYKSPTDALENMVIVEKIYKMAANV